MLDKIYQDILSHQSQVRKLILNQFQDEQLREGAVISDESFQKAVEVEKLEVFSDESIKRFCQDIQKLHGASRLKPDELEKAKKDLSKLVKVTKMDKNGKKVTVWVKRGEEPKKERPQAKQSRGAGDPPLIRLNPRSNGEENVKGGGDKKTDKVKFSDTSPYAGNYQKGTKEAKITLAQAKILAKKFKFEGANAPDKSWDLDKLSSDFSGDGNSVAYNNNDDSSFIEIAKDGDNYYLTVGPKSFSRVEKILNGESTKDVIATQRPAVAEGEYHEKIAEDFKKISPEDQKKYLSWLTGGAKKG